MNSASAEPLTYKLMLLQHDNIGDMFLITLAQHENNIFYLTLQCLDGVDRILRVPRYEYQASKFLYLKLAKHCLTHGGGEDSVGSLVGNYIINDPLKPGIPYLRFREREHVRRES